MSHILNDKWVLWFHDIDETDWSINGYKKIADIDTIENFWNIYKSIDEVTIQHSMFFLMRNGINPIWEDNNNINGGCWSFKINIKDSFQLFIKLAIFAIGENMLYESKNNLSDQVCGLSICQKNNYSSIIQLWNSNRNNNMITILPRDIRDKFGFDIIYRSHIPEF